MRKGEEREGQIGSEAKFGSRGIWIGGWVAFCAFSDMAPGVMMGVSGSRVSPPRVYAARES